jgi:hypothetical protein
MKSKACKTVVYSMDDGSDFHPPVHNTNINPTEISVIVSEIILPSNYQAPKQEDMRPANTKTSPNLHTNVFHIIYTQPIVIYLRRGVVRNIRYVRDIVMAI